MSVFFAISFNKSTISAFLGSLVLSIKSPAIKSVLAFSSCSNSFQVPCKCPDSVLQLPQAQNRSATRAYHIPSV